MKAILFDNYDGYDFEEIKSDLSEMYPDKEITDVMVWDNINLLEDIYYKDMEMELENIFGNNKIIALGTCGTWRGNHSAAKIFNDFQHALRTCTKDCDYIKVEYDKRHIYVTATHHDGTNSFELKILTEKGEMYYDNWCYGNDNKKTEYDILNTIFNSSKYSKLGGKLSE